MRTVALYLVLWISLFYSFVFLFLSRSEHSSITTSNNILSRAVETNAVVIHDRSKLRRVRKVVVYNVTAKPVVYLKSKRIFHYHMRKCGGTTIETIFKYISALYKYDYIAAEGLSLDRRFLDLPRSMSLVSFRNPVDRIISLYWYEHVSWWHGPKLGHNATRCKPIREWIDAWRDGSEFKRGVWKTDPASVFVEVENYYIKSLIGWNASVALSPVGQKELDDAKSMLKRFDIVLLLENLRTAETRDYIKAAFPILKQREHIFTINQLKANDVLKSKLKAQLDPDEDGTKSLLLELNYWDMQLFEYAQELGRERLLSSPQALVAKSKILNAGGSQIVFNTTDSYLIEWGIRHKLGAVRPELHKGP